MRHEKILAVLIASEFVLGIMGVVTEYAFGPFLPSSLGRYLAANGTVAFGLGESLLTGLWVVVAAGTVVAWVGLLNLLQAARPLYVACWVGYLVYILLSGPVVSTAPGYVVQTLMALVGGAVVGMIYFSELRTRFRPMSALVGTAMEHTA